MLHKDTNEVIPFIGVIKDYISEEGEIIIEVRTLDIWLNLNLNFESTIKCVQSFLKIKIENNLNVGDFEAILQKLSIVMWNKICEDHMITTPPKLTTEVSHLIFS